MSLGKQVTAQEPPLVAHLILRLEMGGLQHGLVNLINRTPANRYRHAVICLTGYTSFRDQIARPDVPVIALNQTAGFTPRTHMQLSRLLHRLRPAILHTRNLSVLEGQVAGAIMRVPVRIHGEHGRDLHDRFGTSRKYLFLRRLIDPAVHHYITVSKQLQQWLIESVRVRPAKVTQIYNGVDPERFHPNALGKTALLKQAGFPENSFVVGTVVRMEEVKDPLNLVDAFVMLHRTQSPGHERARLVMIGAGPLRQTCIQRLHDQGMARFAWLPGERQDVPTLLAGFDLFVLPSVAEGVSNTILEAMATGVPVLGTRVGGTPEVIAHGVTGTLVPPRNPPRLAEAIHAYLAHPELVQLHGKAGRHSALRRFSWKSMVDAYINTYDQMLRR